ncbi:phosphoribosylanthranilate isomerase [bacterium]|nr:phosphoribosylanthranilate isomerase [bacterium]
MKRTRVKVCGITNRADALLAADCGADALGFIFADSPRRIDAETARGIIHSLPPFLSAVGVFMDQPAEYITEIALRTGISCVQLHGAETPALCRALTLPVLKRHAVTPASTAASLAAAMRLYPNTWSLLDPGAGSGLTFDWSIPGWMDTGTMVIAGGLDPENIRSAIETLHPWGVDVCSGVESRPGKKDPHKLKAFMENAAG